MYDRATVMDAPNPTLSFSTNISTFFLGNDWRMNVTENFVTFKSVAYTVFAFTNFEDVPFNTGRAYGGYVLHATNNPIINLFVPPI